ncbi:MAG TPA: sn-glycerol-3-phosphate ABC transporter ATP-binding protein UgpC [Gaiellaceae bacterium]|jgi:multiple sugar transport system ATP-binding protein
MAAIAFAGVEKTYPDGTVAVRNLDLQIEDGEFMVLVGPSGCGKTTALRMIAGLEDITGGTLTIGGKIVNDLAPRERDIAMVFQNYALYPHMSVADNIGFGLRMRRMPRALRRERVEAAAATLGLSELLERRPAQLSGGQRQRVAMGRAIVREPVAYLMDEPLSNLDAKLRVQMRAEIAGIQRRLGTTTVYVTHDQIEAMTMGDRVAVMRRGELQQVDTPQRVYDKPANTFVAAFIGSPAMNLLQAQVVADGDGIALVLAGQRLGLGAADVNRVPALRGYAGRTIALGLRPEVISVDRTETGLVGVARFTESLGPEQLLYLDVSARPVVSEEVIEGSVIESADEAIAAELRGGEAEGTASVVARIPPSIAIEPGERVTLSVDVTGLHFFDFETGAALG